MLFLCNHEEADTRLVLHACLQEKNVVIVAKETGMLILLVYPYEISKLKCSWHMKIDHEKFVDISKVNAFRGSRISRDLPQTHAITGCHTTSFLFGTGKVNILKKLKKDEAHLLCYRKLEGRSILVKTPLVSYRQFSTRVNSKNL